MNRNINGRANGEIEKEENEDEKEEKEEKRKGAGGERGERLDCRRVKEKYERVCSSATIKQCDTVHNG